LRKNGVISAIYAEWANLGMLRKPPSGLKEKVRVTLRLYPCDLLFVHRDCETQSVAARKKEIREALDGAFESFSGRVPAVCVVPRRMTEAWLLLSERAIRVAAGNPSGRAALPMPAINALENLPDPKEVLFSLLRKASELHGRRLQSLPVHGLLHRVVELLDDFSLLRNLPAFVAFESELSQALQELGPVDAE
jgi:hypothetical protein